MKQCKNIPYCCIDTKKSRLDHLVLSKTPVKKDEIIYHNARIPVEENAKDWDCLAKTGTGQIFNGFYEKQFNFDPFDIAFTTFQHQHTESSREKICRNVKNYNERQYKSIK